ncbi:MAG TPA: hypothetical protein VK593_09105 [Edaphobacter sp.]|nr:hypothetical protein [Edaphobacter sp.]
MALCKKNLTPLQRRSIQRMGSAMILTLLTNLSTPNLPNPLFDVFPRLSPFLVRHEHSSALVVVLMAMVSALPILAAVWIAGRYLTQEPDEFIRSLVTRSLLWGFAATMAGTAAMSVWMNVSSRPFPLMVLNADLFFLSSALAFRWMQWSYR